MAQLCIRELVEVGQSNIVLDRGALVRMRVDPTAWADVHFTSGEQYRLMIVGEQGSVELRRGTTMNKPYAVYPTWDYTTDTWDQLEELINEPVGDDPACTGDMTIPPDERPIAGQEHRVVIIRCPAANTGPGKQFMNFLSNLQEVNPEVTLHIHGLYGFGAAFSRCFKAVDLDVRTAASKGKVVLPMGKELPRERLYPYQQWVHMLGYTLPDLEVPRNRCMFNIISAVWASQNFKRDVKFRARPTWVRPEDVAFHRPLPETTRPYRGKVGPGDRFLCDTCSLKLTCKYYREEAVCSVPGADTQHLVELFKSRDSSKIIDGLAGIVEIQVHRLEEGLEKERAGESEEKGVVDKSLTTLANSVFESGVKLAKLIDPALNHPKVGVIVNNGTAGQMGMQGNIKELAAKAVRELEAAGTPRDQITEELIMKHLGLAPEPQAIEGQVVKSQELVNGTDHDLPF